MAGAQKQPEIHDKKIVRGKSWQNGSAGHRHNSTSRPVCAPSVCLNTKRKIRPENNWQSKETKHRQASILPPQKHTRSLTSSRQAQKSPRWRIEGNPTARVPRSVAKHSTSAGEAITVRRTLYLESSCDARTAATNRRCSEPMHLRGLPPPRAHSPKAHSPKAALDTTARKPGLMFLKMYTGACGPRDHSEKASPRGGRRIEEERRDFFFSLLFSFSSNARPGAGRAAEEATGVVKARPPPPVRGLARRHWQARCHPTVDVLHPRLLLHLLLLPPPHHLILLLLLHLQRSPWQPR